MIDSLKRMMINLGLKERYLDLSIEEYFNNIKDEELKDNLKKYYHNRIDIIEQGIGLYLKGSLGSGKTCFASVLLRDLISIDYYSGYFIMYSELVSKILSNIDINRMFKDLVNCKVLIIDEFANFKFDDNKEAIIQTFLETLIRTRVSRNLPIIYTTNTDSTNLVKFFGTPVVQSLLKESVIEIIFPKGDFRETLETINKNKFKNLTY